MALTDTGSLTNPLIGGIDHFFEVVIRQDFLWQIASCSGDTGVVHATSPALSCASTFFLILVGMSVSTAFLAIPIALWNARESAPP